MQGPVDKPDPSANSAEQNKTKKTGGGLVVARRNAALLLEMADEALDARTQLVTSLADRVLHLAVALGGDLRRRTAIAQVLTDRVAVIALIGEHRTRIAVALVHQRVIGCAVMRLAFAQHHPDGQAHRIAAEVNFGAEPAAGTAESLGLGIPQLCAASPRGRSSRTRAIASRRRACRAVLQPGDLHRHCRPPNGARQIRNPTASSRGKRKLESARQPVGITNRTVPLILLKPLAHPPSNDAHTAPGTPLAVPPR